jgi:hypothetical protein
VPKSLAVTRMPASLGAWGMDAVDSAWFTRTANTPSTCPSRNCMGGNVYGHGGQSEPGSTHAQARALREPFGKRASRSFQVVLIGAGYD